MVAETRRRCIVNPEQQTISGANFKETIFGNREEMLSNLSKEDLEYLSFVVDARTAIAAGDERQAAFLIAAKRQKLGGDRASQLVRRLRPLISDIHKAMPLPVVNLRENGESHGEVKVGEAGDNDETGELHDPPTGLG